MKKTLIKDYAKEHNISVQAVYAKVKNGTLFSSEIDKKKYIIECENVAVENNANDCKKFKDEILTLKNKIESLKSENIDFKKENENLKSKNDNSDEIESLKTQISFLKSDNKSLKKEKKFFEENSSFYKKFVILFSIISVLLFSMLIFVAYKSHLPPFN